MRDTYHEDLDALGERLIEMARFARHAMERATTALLEADLNAAQEVISEDDALNDIDEEIERVAFDLMARQQPVAQDLRMIITALHMSGDLERMGDLAVHLAKTARRRHPESAIPPELRTIVTDMGQQADVLVAKAGEVLSKRDVDLALQLEQDDDKMDELHRRMLTRILDPDWQHSVESTIDITLAGRFYERFGDHAVHVANHLVYMVTGEKPDDFDREI
ncbi:phosphate signaling complex protein PhoU [Salinactinospora qingdaonensis]|uniref:Phosphate-specific transport system accessory protein PhoU n=1 Tax=Salinactinospora qingdaonensis TaxID=702744 RepID=A0ABP7F1M9_9ACTN